MASNNKVTIVLNAEDNASQKIRDVMRGIEQATSRGTMAGNLMGNAFSKAFELAEKAVGGLVDQLGKAEQSYQSAVKASQIYVNQFGGDLQKGQNAIYKMQQELAKQAAVLPGAGEDYNAIASAAMDNIFGMTSDSSEAMKMITDFSIKMGSRFTRESGITQQQQIRLTERMLAGGQSIKSLQRLMPMLTDPALASAMKKAEVAYGTSFADAHGKKLYNMLMSSFDATQSGKVIEKMSQTYGSAIAQIQDKIFGPFGLFGVSRDLDLKTEGEQSIYTKAGAMMHQLIKLGETIGKITERLGLGSDPMAILGQGLDNLSKFLADVDKALKPFAEGKLKFSFGDFGKITQDFAKGASEAVNKFLDSAIGFLANADTGEIGRVIGNFTGTMVSALGKFLMDIDYGKAFQLILILGAKQFEYFSNMVTSAIGKMAGDLANGVIQDLMALFRAIGDKFFGVFNQVRSALGVASAGNMFGAGSTGAFNSTPAGQKELIPVAPIEAPKTGSPLMQLAPQVAPAPQISIPQGGGLFSPTINLQSNATDPREVANIAIAELGRQFQNYKLGFA